MGNEQLTSMNLMPLDVYDVPIEWENKYDEWKREILIHLRPKKGN